MKGFDQINGRNTKVDSATDDESSASVKNTPSISATPKSRNGLYQFHPEPRHIQYSSLTNNPISGIMYLPFLRLLYHRRKSIDWWRYKHRIMALFFMSLFNSFLAIIESIYVFLLYIIYSYIPSIGTNPEEKEMKLLISQLLQSKNNNALHRPPIFVLGHPRTGTTLLHSLLALDEERFTYCNTFMAGFPHCFLWFERIGKFLFKDILTETRPMDNMKLHFDLPQEDELATNLLSGCQVSPYSSLIFMRDEVDYRKYQCFLEDEVSSKDEETWTYYFLALLRKIQLRDVLNRCKEFRRQKYHKQIKQPTISNNDSNISQIQQPRQVLLKSPCHTGRVRLLLKLFPDAKFIFIHRNPYEVFLSGAHMASTTYGWMFLQQPSDEDMQEYILSQGSILHDEYFRCKDDGILNECNCAEVSFEQLTQNPGPIVSIRKIYSKFGFDSFHSDSKSCYPDRLEMECKELHGYRRNKFKHVVIDDELKETIKKRWQRQFEVLGYEDIYDVSQ